MIKNINNEPLTPESYAPSLYKPIKRGKRIGDNWGIDVFDADSENRHSYNSTFLELLSQFGVKSFEELIEKIRGESQEINILDLMGGGYFLPPSFYYKINTMTGFRLANPEEGFIEDIKRDINFNKNRGDITSVVKSRKKLIKLKLLNKEKKRQVVYGSIYYADGWKKLKANKKERNIPSFNLIICRPQAAFSIESMIEEGQKLNKRQLKKYLAVFDKVFREVIDVVDKKNGIIFFQIPQIFHLDLIEKWTQEIKKRNNISITIAKEKILGYHTIVCKL